MLPEFSSFQQQYSRRELVASLVGTTVVGANILPAFAATTNQTDAKSSTASTKPKTTMPSSSPTAVSGLKAPDTSKSLSPPAKTTSTTSGKATLENPGDVKNCPDFKDYKEAKAWYDKYFPLYGDVARLDGDKNGIPCESLPGAPAKKK